MKTNLVAQLQARGGLSGVRVTYGPPPDPGREFICFWGAVGAQSWATYGTTAGLRAEEYDTELMIRVLKEGVDDSAADARCFALYGELEQQLRTDPTVNGAVQAARIGDFRLEEGIDVDGMNREARLTVQVHCQAFI